MKRFLKHIQTAVLWLACMAALCTKAQNNTDLRTSVQKKRPEPTLGVGSSAPAIIAAKWFKGEPVTRFERGKVYVVEFWATWCWPCRASMPHLSEIARLYKGKATVVSMNVHELVAGKDQTADYLLKVGRFVKRLGNGMDYAVAADVRENTMWNTWLVAAGQYGIPTSFIIDQEGKIAWMGHPILVEIPLQLVVEGRYDDTAKAKTAYLWKEYTEKMTILNAALAEAEKAADYTRVVQVADKILSISPLSCGDMLKTKYDFLNRKDPAAARRFAEDILEKYADNPLALEDVALFIVSSKPLNGRQPDYPLALKIMLQVVDRTDSEDPFITSSLAKVYFKNGDIASAISTQQKVLDLLNDESLVTQQQTVKDEAIKDMQRYKSVSP